MENRDKILSFLHIYVIWVIAVFLIYTLTVLNIIARNFFYG